MAFTCIKCNAEIDRSFKACPHCGEPITDFLREYADKPIDGKYRIVQRLGIGGMGEVFKVEHTFLGSIRVVKIIRAQISGSTDAHDRFLREARLATKVQHPNVATLHDFSALPDGSHYMVWEFIEGENLAQLIRRRGALPARHAVQITIQSLAGLDAIHRAGIVHRDISPENLMITHAADGSEFVKIIDLGVAKATESDAGMTQTGMFVGKFRYASPDHLGFLGAGERIDGRADLYSLAVVLYEMLSGRPPFEATSPHEYIIHHSRDEYLNSPDLDRITGSPALQAILAKALDRDRNKRYASAREFADALSLVEPSLIGEDTKTIMTPFDADATMRTERTSSGMAAPPPTVAQMTTPPLRTTPAQTTPANIPSSAAATLNTPLPGTIATGVSSSGYAAAPNVSPAPNFAAPPHVPAAATVIGTMPGAAPQKSNMGLIIGLVLLALLFFGALAGFALWRFWPHATLPTTSTTTTTATATTASAKPSQTSVDVTPPAPVLIDSTTSGTALGTVSTTGTAPTSPTATTTTPVAVPPATTRSTRTKPVQEEPPAEEPAAEPEPEPAPVSVVTYREKGDGDANDAALAALRQQLAGTTRVYLSGGDAEMIQQLSNALRSRGITLVSEGAPVEIRFTGSVNPQGFGRKSRSGNATIRKNGRPIFQYVMPREDYRVGDSPAEAFARILGEALGR